MVKKLTSDQWDDLFQEFWIVYPPRKGVRNGKSPSKKSWAKIKEKTLDVFNDILKAVTYFKTTEQWTKNNGEFIPMPATFLNQQRWDIEFTDDMEKAIADDYSPKESNDDTNQSKSNSDLSTEKNGSEKSQIPSSEAKNTDDDKPKIFMEKNDADCKQVQASVKSGSLRKQYLSKLGYE